MGGPGEISGIHKRSGSPLGAIVVLLLVTVSGHSPAADPEPIEDRIEALRQRIDPDTAEASSEPGQFRVPGANLRIEQCGDYPYHEPSTPIASARLLVGDLATGLIAGLRCIAGLGPRGRLHPYHVFQARRLLDLLEAPQEKTIRCVQDRMFATAVATPPKGSAHDDPLAGVLSEVSHPAIVIDTFRLGGMLSRRHDEQTYRDFFKLDDAQLFKHRTGQALRLPGLHRTRNRAGLLFHESIHWLGHEHGVEMPDLTFLYETCCFGGSDYIDDPALNRQYRSEACGILKDAELWREAYFPYRQMSVWHHKAYNELKPRMREDYTR